MTKAIRSHIPLITREVIHAELLESVGLELSFIPEDPKIKPE